MTVLIDSLLIVDAYEPTRTQLGQCLAEWGYTAIAVADLAAALTEIQAHPLRPVLLPLAHQTELALALLTQLQDRPELAVTPVLLLATAEAVPDRNWAEYPQVVDYLSEAIATPALQTRLRFRLSKLAAQQAASEQAWQTQQLFQHLIDNLPLAVFWKDRHSVYLGCNQNNAEILHLASPADLVGKTDYDLCLSAEIAHLFQERDQQVMLADTPHCSIAEELDQPDGRHAYTTSKIPFHDRWGNVAGILGICEDITARKKAQEALRETEKYERDVHIGRQIQADFFPKILPNLPDWEVAFHFSPAREVAGDFYDTFPLIHGWAGFVIADVCDKGVGAALFMALFRSLIRSFTETNTSITWDDVIYYADDKPLTEGVQRRRRQRASPSIAETALTKGISLTNNYIATTHSETNMFATTFFAVLDPATGIMKYINGGHEPPVIVGRDGIIKCRLKRTGPAVGMIANAKFKIEGIQLEPGDTLIAYTDGVTDARTPDGQLFSEKRLFNVIEEGYAPVGRILDRIVTRLRNHIADADQFDDITMLGVQWSPTVSQE
ncbi:SpoIIE family protein phosphatase [Trichothermofontia sichuanensis B231]|uniref:PP2C family protein-serine/threonine phosphatase n=1 Tax=Trichothermofontia sichuanensis TaxID=3045816 RepID=UPI002247622E|nr:SpoIIE family protein phosphatase [Trichothermofontia sichuanensis]UZQ52879.1 SpoIIE family protein phosphatase [Trichothermofontia sichuanensis B231]